MVNVVVVNYKTDDDLLGFIESYKADISTTPHNLTIVDVERTNESAKRMRQKLSELVIGDYKYYWANDNIGYARACNFAYNKRSGDVIAFFNADTRLGQTTLDDCYSLLTSDDAYGVVGPLQVNDFGQITHAGIFGTNTKPLHRNWQQPVNDEVRDIREAVTVSGSAYFLKRELGDIILNDPIFKEVFPEAVGPFPLTQHFFEETGVSYLSRHFGYKVMYLGTTQMVHRWHKASPVGGIAETKWFPESQKIFRDLMDRYGILHD